jgi:hypothetical protein
MAKMKSVRQLFPVCAKLSIAAMLFVVLRRNLYPEEDGGPSLSAVLTDREGGLPIQAGQPDRSGQGGRSERAEFGYLATASPAEISRAVGYVPLLEALLQGSLLSPATVKRKPSYYFYWK